MQKYVPVVDKNGKPLMPTTNKKADKLIAKGRAIRRFDRGLFYIKIIDREGGYTQPIAIGIDQGEKKEAYTIKSATHTYLNIQADAVTWVSDAENISTAARKARRQRNTPYRKMRLNRNQGQSFLAPSIRARWGWKLRICNWLIRYYPIDIFAVENIIAKSKIGNTYQNKRWNKSFNPLQIGKKWFYSEIEKLGKLRLVLGEKTYDNRKDLGLTKSKNKLSDNFDAHCVDSWVLANLEIGGHVKPDNICMIHIVPLRFHRRQLHRFHYQKGGKRPAYGGTVSMGLKRGSWIRHPKYGVCYVGGSSKGRLSLNALNDGSRLCKNAKIEDCKLLTRSSWRLKNFNNQFFSGTP